MKQNSSSECNGSHIPRACTPYCASLTLLTFPTKTALPAVERLKRLLTPACLRLRLLPPHDAPRLADIVSLVLSFPLSLNFATSFFPAAIDYLQKLSVSSYLQVQTSSRIVKHRLSDFAVDGQTRTIGRLLVIPRLLDPSLGVSPHDQDNLGKQELEAEDEKRPICLETAMDIPMQDPDGPENLTELGRNPGKLEQDEISVFQPQFDTSVSDDISQDPRYGGFPVHIVPFENKRILDPPCKVCGNLDAANFKWLDPELAVLEINNLEQLKEGSGSGCWTCALIRAMAQPYGKDMFPSHLYYRPQDAGTPGMGIAIRLHGFEWTGLEICAIEGATCPFPSVFHRPLTWNSTIACRQISQWLSRCSSNHGCYNVSSFSALPTRVLEIQGPQQVRLHVSGANERASYACLSHCWGGVVPLKLSQTTLREFQQEIPWDRLPRTFKDAVEVARGLDLKFLWIDSLCIVQDDDNDWRCESAMMTSVYSQAYITLAASQAADSTQGLFLDPKLVRYKKVYIGFNGPGKRHEIFLRHVQQLLNKKELPLLQRAWYFQENMLSPRTAHFTESFLYLDCHQGVTRVDQNELYPERLDIMTKIKRGLLEKADPYMWYKVASDYSELSLTYPQDVFPALQGVAKKFQAVRQCDYFAGIWGDNIMMDLLWWRSNEAANFNPLRYIAPTWSWASQPGKVSWDSVASWINNTFVKSKLQPDAVCISISTVPVGDDRLGEVIAGELQLQGRCLSAVILHNEDLPNMHRLKLKDISFSEIEWQPDVNPGQLPDKNVTIMYMGTHIGYPVWLVIVRMSMEREEYKRVGIAGVGLPYFQLGDQGLQDICKDKGERKIVTII
jgi:hypothetical protein